MQVPARPSLRARARPTAAKPVPIRMRLEGSGTELSGASEAPSRRIPPSGSVVVETKRRMVESPVATNEAELKAQWRSVDVELPCEIEKGDSRSMPDIASITCTTAVAG